MRLAAGTAVLAALVAATTVTGRSDAAPTAASVQAVPIVRGFQQPVLAVQAPGEPGRIYVVEQGGLIRVVERGAVRATPFLDVRGLVVAGGEQGLLGLAFPTDYARTRLFYVNYTARAGGTTTIARYRAANGRAVPGSRKVLLTVRQPYANHNGGHLAFGPDRKLWIGLGDGGSGGDPENLAQDSGTLLGKLFRLDVRKARPVPELVGYGLRNPWRYSFDRATGDLWIGDVGQSKIEEISVLRRGTTGLVNFGWDVFEGSAPFEQKPLGPGTLIRPIAEYSHDLGCSVTGGVVVRGTQVPALRGRYVFGDYCSGRIWSLATTGGEPRLEAVKIESLVSFGEALNGTVYAVSHGGTIYRLAP